MNYKVTFRKEKCIKDMKASLEILEAMKKKNTDILLELAIAAANRALKEVTQEDCWIHSYEGKFEVVSDEFLKKVKAKEDIFMIEDHIIDLSWCEIEKVEESLLTNEEAEILKKFLAIDKEIKTVTKLAVFGGEKMINLMFDKGGDDYMTTFNYNVKLFSGLVINKRYNIKDLLR